MKKLLISLAAVAALCGSAYAQVKVALVDMDKVFDRHYKVADLQKQLEANKADVKSKVDAANKELKDLEAKFKEQSEQAQNTALTAEARKNAEADARKTAEVGLGKRQELGNFLQQAQQLVNQRVQQTRVQLMDEIKLAVAEVAKRRGAALALDISGRAGNASPAFLWAANGDDITEEVIKEVNKNQSSLPPPAASSAPAASRGAADASDVGIKLPGK